MQIITKRVHIVLKTEKQSCFLIKSKQIKRWDKKVIAMKRQSMTKHHKDGQNMRVCCRGMESYRDKGVVKVLETRKNERILKRRKEDK